MCFSWKKKSNSLRKGWQEAKSPKTKLIKRTRLKEFLYEKQRKTAPNGGKQIFLCKRTWHNASVWYLQQLCWMAHKQFCPHFFCVSSFSTYSWANIIEVSCMPNLTAKNKQAYKPGTKIEKRVWNERKL